MHISGGLTFSSASFLNLTYSGLSHKLFTVESLSSKLPIMVRMHTANPLEDMLGLVPGKSNQLKESMKQIASEGRGVIVLLRDMNLKLILEGRVSACQVDNKYVSLQNTNPLYLDRINCSAVLGFSSPARNRPQHFLHARLLPQGQGSSLTREFFLGIAQRLEQAFRHDTGLKNFHRYAQVVSIMPPISSSDDNPPNFVGSFKLHLLLLNLSKLISLVL